MTTPKPGKPATQTRRPQTATPATATPETTTSTRKTDLSALLDQVTFTEAPAPKRAPGAGRKSNWVPNERLLTALKGSWAERKVLREYKKEGVVVRTTYIGGGRATIVPKDSAGAFSTALRRVGEYLGLGVSIVVDTDKVPAGMVRVSFAAKTMKAPKQTSKTPDDSGKSVAS